jgi:hypothetical protein
MEGRLVDNLDTELEEELDKKINAARKEGDKYTVKKFSTPNKAKLRNLAQYKNMPEDEFEDLFEKKRAGVESNTGFENRVNRKIKEISSSYELDDMNSNDIVTLRSLAQALINLEDYEQAAYNLRADGGINLDNITLVEKLSKVQSDLRRDIGEFQDDLKISRRIRKADKEQSVVDYLESLKKKAKEFYESRMSLILCPKCNTLLATVWTLYPSEKGNKITLVCNSPQDNNEICGEKFTITTKELLESFGTNTKNIPESMR